MPFGDAVIFLLIKAILLFFSLDVLMKKKMQKYVKMFGFFWMGEGE